MPATPRGDGADGGDPVLAVTSSVAELLIGAAKAAVTDSLSECVRAEGKRGMVYLSVQLCLGDGGEVFWLTSDCHFEQKRHRKDR